jgi:hypothetical protein
MISKPTTARICGLLYFLIIVFGLIAQVFVRDSLVDYSNARVTASNIVASEFWYRFGFVSELLMLVCDVGVTTILFILLKDTNKNFSILSTLFRVVSICILGIAALTHYAALSFLEKSTFLSVFTTEELNAFSLLAVRMHGVGYNISLLFFGFHLIVLSYLIYRSLILPKFLGILLVIGGLCYIVNSLIWFLFPELVKVIYPAILIPCALGEWILCFWLLIKGIKRAS